MIEISLMISPLILILLGLRKKIFGHLGKTARLLLWAPLLIQLLIPIQLTSVHSPYQKLTETSLADTFAESLEQIESVPLPMNPAAGEGHSSQERIPRESSWTLSSWLTAVWVTGVLIMGGVNLLARLKLKRRLRLHPCPDLLMRQANRQMRENHCLLLPVRQSDSLHSCAIYGNFMPQLILGSDFLDRTEAQRRIMLDHECLHVKYGHPWFLGVVQILEIIYWFNPFVRLMMNQLRLDLEYFIDEKLLENKPQSERISYARLLLACSADNDQRALQCLNSRTTQKRLKERLGWIVNKKRTPWLAAAGIVLVSGIICAGMMLKPDMQSGWEMTMKVTLMQNAETPVVLVNEEPGKAWCEGSKKALESMGMQVPVIARAETWKGPMDEPLTLEEMRYGMEAAAQLEWGELPDSVECFFTQDVLIRLTDDQLWKAEILPESDGGSVIAKLNARSPLENPDITCGWNCYAGHQAVDVRDPNNRAAPILAAAEGSVMKTGSNFIEGKYIILEHIEGIQSFYGHLEEIQVSEGETVQSGERIGIMGATGRATGPHLHFYFFQDGVILDPTVLFS